MAGSLTDFASIPKGCVKAVGKAKQGLIGALCPEPAGVSIESSGTSGLRITW